MNSLKNILECFWNLTNCVEVVGTFCKGKRGFDDQQCSSSFFPKAPIKIQQMFQTRNLHNLHFPDNTFQGRICLQRQILDFLGPHTHRVWLQFDANIYLRVWQNVLLSVWWKYSSFSLTECSYSSLTKICFFKLYKNIMYNGFFFAFDFKIWQNYKSFNLTCRKISNSASWP